MRDSTVNKANFKSYEQFYVVNFFVYLICISDILLLYVVFFICSNLYII